MADALVHAGTGYDFGLGRGRNRTVFQNPRGLKYYYSLYVDDSSDLILEYSTDGSDWTNTVQTVYTGTVEDFDVKIRDTATLLDIYVILYDSAVSDLTYIRGTMGDAASTPTWDTAQDIDAAINEEIDGLMSVTIARTDNGRLVVTFTEDYRTKGKNYRQTKIIGADGDGAAPTWSGETTIDDPSGNSNNDGKNEVYLGMESFSSSYPNRVLIYGSMPHEAASYSYRWKFFVYDWDGSSFTQQATAFIAAAAAGENKMISCIIDNDDKVHVLYTDQTGDINSNNFPDAGGLGALGVPRELHSTVGEDGDALTLVHDVTNDDLYAFYHIDDETTTYHYRQNTNPASPSGNWGAEQNITSSDTVIHLSSWNVDIESYLHLAYVDNDGDIYYDSLDLSVAGWGHTFNGVASANISSISGVATADIDTVKGV